MTLNLDTRQRAMLKEMGVQVWAPMQAPAAPSATAAEHTTGRGVAAPAPSPAATAVEASATADPGTLAWTDLQSAVRECRACGLCAQRQHTVFGIGGLKRPAPDTPPRADWLIVGEAPGEQEDLRGEPFVGTAGQLLDNMLRAVGLDRSRHAVDPNASDQAAMGVYIANVLKCRPPGNRNPEPAEVAQCTPYLKRQIELLQPKLIVAMGRFAAHTLLQDTVPDVHTLPLGRLRGKVHTYAGIPLVVTYHPAYLLRAMGDKAKAWADLCLALSVHGAQAPEVKSEA